MFPCGFCSNHSPAQNEITIILSEACLMRGGSVSQPSSVLAQGTVLLPSVCVRISYLLQKGWKVRIIDNWFFFLYFVAIESNMCSLVYERVADLFVSS